MKKLIIFDLDGTLLNTIADLAHSTNYALKQNGFPQHEINAYNYFVGNGINKLFERSLPENSRNENNILNIRKIFLPYYNTHNTDYSVPYPGIPELLANLQDKGYKLAVASNKYQDATQKLVSYFFPSIQFVAVLGQREGINIKPDPAIVNTILSIAKVNKDEVLYIGDSGVDMQTAANSKIISVGVTWGFRPRTELEENKACYIIDQAAEVLSLLD